MQLEVYHSNLPVGEECVRSVSLPKFDYDTGHLQADRRGYIHGTVFFQGGVGFSAFCEIPYFSGDSWFIEAHPHGHQRIRTARRVKLDEKTSVYVWNTEELLDRVTIVDAKYGSLVSLRDVPPNISLAGLVNVHSQQTGLEKLFELEADFTGKYHSYTVETRIRELPFQTPLLLTSSR